MMNPKLKYYRIFWTIAALWLLLDQVSKYWVQHLHSLQGGTHFFNLGHWLNIVYVRNTGAAWGVLSGNSLLLGLLAVVALAAIYFLRIPLQIKRTPLQVAFGLLVAGILGNMLDRLFLGYVVDFIDLGLWGLRFLVFNFADVGITAGVSLYVLNSLWEGLPKKAKNSPVVPGK